jgi:hypothetical protein
MGCFVEARCLAWLGMASQGYVQRRERREGKWRSKGRRKEGGREGEGGRGGRKEGRRERRCSDMYTCPLLVETMHSILFVHMQARYMRLNVYVCMCVCVYVCMCVCVYV